MDGRMSERRMLEVLDAKPPGPPRPPAILTGSQARLARGSLGWTQDELASRAKVSLADVREIEADRAVPKTTLTRVRQAFEGARIEIAGGALPRLRA